MTLFSLGEVAKAHHASMADDDNSPRRVLISMYGPAVVVLVLIGVVAIRYPKAIDLGAGSTNSLAAAFALFAGVLFGLGLTVLDKAIDMDLTGVSPGPTTERAAERLQGLAANTLFTSMLSMGATALLVIASLFPKLTELMTALAVAVMILVGTNAALIAGRVFSEAKWRTDRARTGESEREARTDGDHD